MNALDSLLAGLKAVAEPTRLRLLCICARGEFTVSEIQEIVGQSQPRVSRHLKLLCNADLLVRHREQHWVYYRVSHRGPGAELVRTLLTTMPETDPQLDLDRRRLEAVLDRRAEAARDLVEASGLEQGVATLDDEADVDVQVLRYLGGDPIGELLDIGTGTGRMLRLLGQKAERAIGIDISRAMLMLARSNLHTAGLDHLSVRHGNMYQLRFPDQSFDTVTIDQVLFQAEQPGEVLREAARVLRPGGRLLLLEFITDTTYDLWEADADDLAAIDEQRIEEWFQEAGLRGVKSRRFPGQPFPVVLTVARRLQEDGEAAA
jgi:ArsR family transcriptional regulator